MTKINGGATIWARQTIDSDIFYDKPDVWFKIWFYLVNQVNHKDDKRFKRGSCFLKYEWIMDKTGATYNQVKHCLEYLKSAKQIATQKKTRGMLLTVINYDFYQTLDNYYYEESQTERKTKARQKPDRSHTINKNDKNDKNGKNGKKRDTLSGRCALIISYLNEKTRSNFNPKNESTTDLIKARFNEGRTVKDFIEVMDKKLKDWLTDGRMVRYLRPSTLFNRTNFENYLNEPKEDKYAKYYKKE